MGLWRSAALVTLAAAGAAWAQTPAVLICSGETVSLDGHSYTLNSIDAIAASQPGVYAASVRGSAGNQPRITLILGSRDGSARAILQAPDQSLGGPSDPLRARFEPGLGISSAGRIVYSAEIANRPGGVLSAAPGFLDSLFLDTADPAAPAGQCTVLSGTAVPNTANAYWTFASQPGILVDGTPCWLGGTSATPGLLSDASAVYRGVGTGIERLIGSGDAVLGFGSIAAPFGVRQFSFSPGGGRLIAIVNLDAGGSRLQAVTTVETTLTSAAQITMIEGDLVDDFMPGSYWREFRFAGVGDLLDCHTSPAWFVAGNTSAPNGSSWLILRNGDVSYREGDQVGGLTLVGAPLAATMNSGGDLLFLWPAALAGYAATPVLFLNGIPILKPTDAVTGDGVSATIDHIWPTVALSNADETGLLDVYAVVNTTAGSGRLVRKQAYGQLPVVCLADFNLSGGIPDDADISAFLSAWAAGDERADVNCSGGVPDDNDVSYFFERWNEGC